MDKSKVPRFYGPPCITVERWTYDHEVVGLTPGQGAIKRLLNLDGSADM